jgi:hypothetical protein
MSNYNNYFNTIQNVEIDEAVVQSALYAEELNVPSINIGPFAGDSNQGDNAIAIGADAGEFGQGAAGIAIGVYAGYTGQNEMAIAIGGGAGQTNQGTNSIAIGENASATGANAIVLNATGSVVTGFTGGFFATPIRNVPGTSQAAFALWYNTTSKEICYGTLT